MRILGVFEFGGRSFDSMSGDILDQLSQYPNVSETRLVTGFLSDYRAGGLSFIRILNLLFVYLRLPWEFATFRPSVVMARTTPPLVQIWCVALGLVFRTRTVCWMMDYHPEIEARAFEKRGWGMVARWLRAVDRWSLKRMSTIITLDEAMAKLCKEQAPDVELIVHPTWNTGGEISDPPGVGLSSTLPTRHLRLVYAGNLGKAHGTDILEKLLVAIQRHHPVELIYIGNSSQSRAAIREVASTTNTPLKILDRVDRQEDLADVYRRLECDLGIVLMKDWMAGLVSPSKFSGYIRFGLPLLYIGPELTNADIVAERFGAGLALRNTAQKHEIETAARLVVNAEKHAQWRLAARQAWEFFKRQDGNVLAKKLYPLVCKK